MCMATKRLGLPSTIAATMITARHQPDRSFRGIISQGYGRGDGTGITREIVPKSRYFLPIRPRNGGRPVLGHA